MSDHASRIRVGDESLTHAIVLRVQQTDPAAGEEAVRRFLVEMDEAREALGSIDLADVALPVEYSSFWPEEENR
jgi:hypothetical protein